MQKNQPATLPPTVTILMLTYNRAGYISEAIESVLAQTYADWELVIIDDGSTDETEEVVAPYAARDTRLRYIKHGDNQGLCARRKESLSYVRGVYAAVLDSDDIWTDKEKLEKQVAYMAAHSECVVVGTQITLIDAHGHTVGSNRYATEDAAIRRQLLWRNQFAHSSVLMQSAGVEQVSGYHPLPIGEDLDLFLRLGTIGTLANLPDAMVAYRIHQVKETADKRKTLDAVRTIIADYRTNYPHYRVAVIKNRLQRCLTGLL